MGINHKIYVYTLQKNCVYCVYGCFIKQSTCRTSRVYAAAAGALILIDKKKPAVEYCDVRDLTNVVCLLKISHVGEVKASVLM